MFRIKRDPSLGTLIQSLLKIEEMVLSVRLDSNTLDCGIKKNSTSL